MAWVAAEETAGSKWPDRRHMEFTPTDVTTGARSSSALLPALWKPHAHLPTTRYHEDGVPFWSPMLSPRPAQTSNPRLHTSIHRRLPLPPSICDSKLQRSNDTMVRCSCRSCGRRDTQSTCLRRRRQ